MNMKTFKLINIVLILALSGCSLWPRAHDPALAQSFVSTKIAVSKLDCAAKTGFEEADRNARWLEAYATFRADPQLESAKGVVTTINKAEVSSEKVCEHWVKLANGHLEVLNKAWSGR